MRSLLAAVALAVVSAVLAFPAAPAVAHSASVRACVPWETTVLGSRSGFATLAPTVDCSAEGVPSASTGSRTLRVQTGIAVSVRRGPIRPVCVAGVPCDAPAAGVLVEIDSGGTEVARLRTGKAGTFVVRTPPGSYVVRLVSRRATPVPVRVRAGLLSRVTLTIDTGIR